MRAVLVVLFLVLAAPAGAARLTLGSNLQADATVIESHGADSAFWPISVQGVPGRYPRTARSCR